MKTNLKRVLSFVLVMMMLISCVPAVALAAEDVHAAQNITTGVQYDSLADAMAAATAGQTVKALADCDESVMYNEGVILDLNGHNLINVTVPAGVTLTAIDSATDDYAGSFGTLSGDIAGTVASTVKTAEPKSYVSVCENGSWSFHRYYAAITAISLKPASAALGYKAEFYGDEVVRNAVSAYGYALWVNDNAPKTLSKTDKLEKNMLTLRLQNILKEGNDALNALGSTANINGKAFITLNLNGQEVTLSSAEKTTTLRATIESINANVAAYNETALQAVRSLCTTYAAWMAGWATENIFAIGEGAGDLDVEITVPVTAENNVVTEDTVLRYENIVATVPAGAQLAEGTTELKLTIIDKNASDSDVAENAGETLRPLDVHIEGISENNNAPIIICLGNILPKGLNIGNYELYHVEDGETVPMTRAYSVAELDAHNEFCYDPATGAVTIAVCSFSEIALRSNTENIWNGNFQAFTGTGTANDPYIIANADQLAQMSKLVSTNNEYASACYKLISDLDFGGYSNTVDENDVPTNVFYPIGYWKEQTGFNAAHETYYGYGNAFQGVFDGNGNTIANLCQRTWDMNGNYDNGYWDDAMGLFGATYDATIKNLTIENFQSDGEYTVTGCVVAYAGGNSTFENITLTNCNPRVYNTGNGGIVGMNYNSTTEGKKDTLTFKNITIDQTNKITALWGSWDVSCGGIMGRLRDDEKHTDEINTATFENCHVSAVIDVYNDVCANYQYYQYRYSGMLIGTVDYVDTLGVNNLSNIVKANGCTVTYGDWNEYWYCELVANTQASYTHDYQFSRLEKISSIADISDDNGQTWKKTGNFVIPATNEGDAVCYHIVNKDGNLTRHMHVDAGYEDLDGDGNKETLKEDRQHYYIPFGQLFTGYGWGSTMRDAFDGITVNGSDTVKSTEKFTAKNISKLKAGEVAIGDLFELAVSKDKLSMSTLQVFVSPADKTSTVSGSFSGNNTTWNEGKLTITGTGKAKITITDYFYCINTTLTVDVYEGYIVSFAVPNGVDAIADMTGTEITLPTSVGVPTIEDDKTYTFAGWNKEEIKEPNAEVTPLTGTYTPSENTVLYPVYSYETEGSTTEGTTSYVKVTTAPANWSGEYLIVYEGGNVAFDGALTTLDAVSNTVSVTISNNKIEYTKELDESTFTIDASGTIKSASGYYIGQDSNANGLASSKTITYTNTISINSDGTVNLISSGAYLRYNATSGQNRFRYYRSSSYTGQKAISLYKKTITHGETIPGDTYYLTFPAACAHSSTSTTTVDATCTTAGSITIVCCDCGETVSTTPIAALGHTEVIDAAVAATCTATGLTEGKHCSVCNTVIVAQTTVPMIDHNYADGKCTVCGAEDPDYEDPSVGGEQLVATFEFGANGSASHVDGSKENNSYSETNNGYTLKFTNGTKVYPSSFDAKGNSCIKLGASSTGSFSFTVPSNITKVVIKVAQYKANTTKITVNGASYTIATASNNGAYTDITVDTTSTKTVTFATASGGVRAMVNSIAYYGLENGGSESGSGSGNEGGDATTAEATLSFASTAQRTSQSTSKQVWENDGIIFTNNKASSSSNVANYYNPVRCYASSEIMVEHRNMTRIVFTCANSSYATALKNSITNINGTVTSSGSTVTIEFNSAVDKFTIAKLSAQVQIMSIEVSYQG